jgi:hypothetical protein
VTPAAYPAVLCLFLLALLGMWQDISFFVAIGSLGAGFVLGAEWMLWTLVRSRRRP